MELGLAKQKLEALSSTDGLTGLAQALYQGKKSGRNKVIALFEALGSPLSTGIAEVEITPVT